MPMLQNDYHLSPSRLSDHYSLEITAKDVDALHDSKALIAPDTQIAITFLPGEDPSSRLAATQAVRKLGFEPMPHFSARRIDSLRSFETYLHAAVAQAGVTRCFVVAGDPLLPEGPFSDSAALIATGAFERAGIRTLGVGGHPEGHPHMSEAQCWDVLQSKCAEIAGRGMEPLIVTQFGFNADPFVSWLDNLRRWGIDAPVRIGIPGPAGIKTLLRFAGRCGVGASTAVMAKYGISITRLIGTAGPERLIDDLAARILPSHGDVRLHFYPFGGIERTVRWIENHRAPR
ncbi:methylenetetrahydrofolate reductase [Sphingobium sp. CAP-1]|uniref:methylenetetrahydrofolate reductase n=1 Tax=Sphingobium sp. CAP-1 TaxID=2676077 RepID=UPI002E31F5C3|nr:methylenetetrahydrofolate reductase [Sphingobium sp. CAP-1]